MKKHIIIIYLLLLATQSNSHDSQRWDLLTSITNKRVAKFVNKHYQAAQQLWECDSIPMAISLAQWGLESGWGRSDIAINKFNLGGIKLRSGEYRTFASYSDFYKAYRDVLKKPCYRRLNPQELWEWIDALFHDECRYATSKNYKHKMWNVIFCFNLDLLV